MNHIQVDGVSLEVSLLTPQSHRQPANASNLDGDGVAVPDAPTLVFLHEGLGSAALWPQKGRHWPQELCDATGLQGWLYSRRGYGQSAPIPDVRGESRKEGLWSDGRHTADYMHVEAWEVLPKVLDALRVSSPILVGHSDGATIALLHASRFDVKACIVMAPHLFVEDMTIQSIEQARDTYLETHGSEKGLRSRLARYHADVENAFWQWNDVWLSEAFRRFDIRAECAQIKAPLFAIQGLDDEYGTMAQLQDLREAAPQARLLALPACGHSPHRDQPDALTKAVCEFIESVVN